MVLRILIAVFVCIIAIFALMWLLTGGAGRVLQLAQNIRNPALLIGGGSASGTPLKLPWQIDVAVPESGSYNYGETDLTSESFAQDTGAARQDMGNDAATFGLVSPYRGQISIDTQASVVNKSDPHLEYVVIRAATTNTAPISLVGWSLQSALSGGRVLVPQAADPFVLGVLNTVIPAQFAPGAVAVVVSGASPVGVSFRENNCTGYLAELQSYIPQLDTTHCPDPVSSPDLQSHASCADYFNSIPRCHFPGIAPHTGVSSECINLAANALSYNGCVARHEQDAGFKSNVWRLYVAAGVELWRNSHDVIRLLDAQGQTVDILTY